MAENIKASFEVDEDEIERKIVQEFVKHLNSSIDKNVARIEQNLRLIIAQHITNSHSWQALAQSHLDNVLQIPNFQSALDNIIAKVANSAVIELRRVSSRGSAFVGGLTVSILKSDYSDILSLSSSSFTAVSGLDIEWVKWLLTAGSETVVLNYGFTFHASSPQGNNQFAMPVSLEGVQGDNVLTRSLVGIESELESLLTDIF